MHKSNAQPVTALITGASGGIGYELAKLFAKDHHNLVLVARNETRLAQVAGELQRQFGISARPIVLDLGTPGSPQALFEQMQRQDIAVNILINNAGYGKLGEFAEISVEESLGQIELNVTALTCLTRLFMVPMIKRSWGKIMNVASTAGFQPGPLMAVYYATKAYVISFSEALANELADSGITVTCLCPGPTETGFAERRQRQFSLVQTAQADGCQARRAQRLSRVDGRQDAGDSRIQEPPPGGVIADQSAQAGDRGLAAASG